jgi:hypothetical protein
MSRFLPLSLALLLFAPSALAQNVQIDAPPWTPGEGVGPIPQPGPIGRTPIPERPAQPGPARSHLHPGDAQRRQDERDAADQAALQRSLDAENARSVERMQRELLNQQYSDQIRSQQAERDRAVIELQLAQPQPILPAPPNLKTR